MRRAHPFPGATLQLKDHSQLRAGYSEEVGRPWLYQEFERGKKAVEAQKMPLCLLVSKGRAGRLLGFTLCSPDITFLKKSI